MKRTSIMLFAFVLLFTGCKKDTVIDEVDKIDEVVYKVNLINATSWHGVYFNQNAQTIGVEDQPDNWTYSFKNTNRLIALSFDAYPDGLNGNEDAYLQIYLNGKLVAATYSSLFPRAQYFYP